jgi:hypothetical protein
MLPENVMRYIRPVFGRTNVMFISYPKSGRTWMRYAAGLAGVKMKFSHAGHGTSTVAEIGEAYRGLQKADLRSTNIFMFRNPLDTAVSLYFQVQKTDFAPGGDDYAEKLRKLESLGRLPPQDINEFVLHPVWGCGQIAKFNRDWHDYFISSGELILQYEDMRKDPREALQRVFDYVGARGRDVESIAATSSFEKMRDVELNDAGAKQKYRLQGRRGGDDESMKVRRGLVKGYVDYLRPETIAAAAAIVRKEGFDI